MRKVLLLIVHIAEADASLGLEQALVVTRRRERMVEHLLMLHRLLLLLLGLDVMLPAEEIRTDEYRRTLEDQPWRHCNCGLCAEAGIDIAMFRGSERNKRRGFHNLSVFRQRITLNGFPSL